MAKIYFASMDGARFQDSKQFGYFYKLERAKAVMAKEVPASRGQEWTFDANTQRHHLRLPDRMLFIRQYDIQLLS